MAVLAPSFNPGAAAVWNGLAGKRTIRSDYQVPTPDDYDQIAAELIALETLLKGIPSSITFAPAAGAANICLLTCTLLDAAGVALTTPYAFDLWLSDSAAGVGLTATTASGAVAAGASGADFGDYTAKKAKHVQSNGSGLYILSITDTAKTIFYPCACICGKTVVGARLVTGNYG